MRFKVSKSGLFIGGAVSWLIVISALHFWLNFDHGQRKIVLMGYMPVITNMAAPLLDHVSKKSGDIYFKALKFSSFSEMAEALRNDEIQVAFMIAPLSIVLRQQGVDVKVVYIGNRNESTLVAKKGLHVKNIQDLAGKTVAVPMRYSGHNISLLDLMDINGLNEQINIVEMNPPDMASAMVAGALDAYYVGEPFAAQSLKNDSAELVFYVEEVWESFICNLVIVKQSLIEEDRETVRKLVSGAVRSGLWAGKHPDQAAEIAARYWSQPVELVRYAFDTDRIIVDQFTPKVEEMQEIADLMVKHNLIDANNIKGLVDDQFTSSLEIDNLEELDDIL